MKNDDFEVPELKGAALEKKVYSLLGLAKRGGFAQGGEFLCEKAVKSLQSRLVIVAGDASDNTKKNFSDMCEFYRVPYLTFGDKDSLGHAIGVEFRASVTINNEGFAKKLLDLLNGR